jgi:hypothetical protein
MGTQKNGETYHLLAAHKDFAIQLRASEGDLDRRYFEAIFRFILSRSLVWNFSFDIFHEWRVGTGRAAVCKVSLHTLRYIPTSDE